MQIRQIATNPFLFRIFLFAKLPLAFFAGIRIKSTDEKKSIVSVKSGWLANNPFRSMYFATQCMAAELATGISLLQALEMNQQNASTLVLSMNSSYHSKAVGRILFQAEWSDEQLKVLSAMKSTDSEVFTIPVSAKNSEGEIVSDFEVVWSVKIRS